MKQSIVGFILFYLLFTSTSFAQTCPSSYLWYRDSKFIYFPSQILFDASDSTFFVAAHGFSDGNPTVISKTNKQGIVKWMYNHNFVIGDPLEGQIIREMLLTPTGNLVGCGFHLLTKKGFVFRMDTSSKLMTHVLVNDSVCFSGIKLLTNGNLYLTGTVNPGAGGFTKNTFKGYLNPNNLSSVSTVIIDHFQNFDHVSKVVESDSKIYGICDNTIGGITIASNGSFYQFDIKGKILQSYSYLNNNPDVLDSRNNDIIKDGNEIVVVGNSRNINSSSQSDVVHFYKFKDDSLLILKNYVLPTPVGLSWKHIQSVSDGYLIYGIYGVGIGKLWLTKTDKQGEILWSKIYADPNADRIPVLCNFFTDQHNIYTFSQGKDNQRISNGSPYLGFDVFGKNGEAPECMTSQSINLQKINIPTQKENFISHTYPNDNSKFEDKGFSRGGMSFLIDSTCRCKPCNLEGAIPDTLYFDYLLKIEISPIMTGANGKLNYSWKLLGSGSINCDTCPKITFSPDCPEKCVCNDSKVVVKVTENEDCEWTDTIVLKYKLVAPCCNLKLSSFPDTIRFGSQDSVTLVGTVLGDLTNIRYTWTTDNGKFSCDTCKQTKFVPECTNLCDCFNSSVIFKAETFPQCNISDTVFMKYSLILSDSIAIPNAFTPNGDNTNDVFTVITKDGGCKKRIARFDIYNRWGQLVFSPFEIPNEDFTIGWDGHSDLNGEALPMDVYVYIIEIVFDGKETKTYKGEVLLVR